ncbi:MAG: hypothetical protein AB1898_04855 [Acidobacteriota bacterium]
MKRTVGITLIAVGLVATGMVLASFISNPLTERTGVQRPILVSADGTQVAIQPAAGLEGRAAPIIINVRTSAQGNPSMYDYGSIRPVPVRAVQTVYESAPPRRVPRSTDTRVQRQRSWQESALIIAGSAGAGAGIGAIAGGRKGAAVGAASGGVAGLVYDLATRR